MSSIPNPSPLPQGTEREASPSASLRSDLEDAIVANPITAGKDDPDGPAGKGGDVEAAMRHAQKLLSPDAMARIRAALPAGLTAAAHESPPLVLGVISLEASGLNKIPMAVAKLLAHELGLKTCTDIVQSTSPKRTAMNGLDRIFHSPEFDGPVEAGRQYILVDDTLTQGATFASLAQHIRRGGGHVEAAISLTGKGYSAKIRPDPAVIDQLRSKHGEFEASFKTATGHGFDDLTNSETRYLLKFEPALEVRDRIVAAARERQRPADGSMAGRAESPGNPDGAGVDRILSAATTGSAGGRSAESGLKALGSAFPAASGVAAAPATLDPGLAQRAIGRLLGAYAGPPWRGPRLNPH